MTDDNDVNRLRIALGRIARTVDRQITGDGLTRTQLSILGTLAREKSIGISELAEIEGLNPTMLSRIVGKLEATGLVQRTPSPDDRRSVVVEITAAGAKTHAKLRRQRTALFAELLAELPDDEVAALMVALPALESLSERFKSAGRATATAGSRR
jgi:DNA-binding MarR family transcriptional regulator